MNDLAELYPVAFTQGRTLVAQDQEWHFSMARAGDVSLPSGRIVACDPLVSGSRDPFLQSVPRGRYPVDLALARAQVGGERIAFARVMFTARQPAVWVMALRRGEKEAALAKGAIFGYTAESGTGAFMDAETAVAHDLSTRPDIDEILEQLTANYRPNRYWLDYPVARKHNIIMFAAGSGEGRYASYFGIDEAGDVCVLVTDFQVISS
jgi:hypothetical protein